MFWHIIIHRFPYNLFFVFVRLVAMASLSFLILIIWVFSLFFLVRLVKGLSAKKQFLVLLLFSILFLTSISFISAPVSIISFLLLAVGLVHSSFSSFLRWKVMSLIWDLFLPGCGWVFWGSLFLVLITPNSLIQGHARTHVFLVIARGDGLLCPGAGSANFFYKGLDSKCFSFLWGCHRSLSQWLNSAV